MTGPFRPGHDGGGLGLSPMKPSAKRALLLPAWPERRLWGQVAGIFWPVACGRIRGVLAGGVRAFLGPCAARQWCDGLAVDRLADKREAGRVVGL